MQLTFASFPVRDGLGGVPVESLLAVVAVSPRRVVSALETDAATNSPRQLVQLHVEPASPSVQVAIACCNGGREKKNIRILRCQSCWFVFVDVATEQMIFTWQRKIIFLLEVTEK